MFSWTFYFVHMWTFFQTKILYFVAHFVKLTYPNAETPSLIYVLDYHLWKFTESLKMGIKWLLLQNKTKPSVALAMYLHTLWNISFPATFTANSGIHFLSLFGVSFVLRGLAWGEEGFQRERLKEQQLPPVPVPSLSVTCQGLEQIMHHCPHSQSWGSGLAK